MWALQESPFLRQITIDYWPTYTLGQEKSGIKPIYSRAAPRADFKQSQRKISLKSGLLITNFDHHLFIYFKLYNCFWLASFFEILNTSS